MAKEFFDFSFEIKSEVSEEGIFEGYGSTFGGKKDSPKDEYWGDIVEKGAFTETIKKGGRNGNGILMLFNHDPDKEHGVWLDLHEDSKGLFMRGKFALDTQLGRERHSIIKMKKAAQFSIGFDSLKYRLDEEKRTRYLEKTDLWEISDVTFPKNTRAVLTSVKAIEEVKNIRELEGVLREVGGLSFNAAKAVIRKVRENLREVDKKNTFAIDPVLQALRSINGQMDIERELRNCHV